MNTLHTIHHNIHPFVCGQAQDGCCTPATPCDLGGGDCDSDLDCAGSLVCGTDNCRQHHSGAVAAQ